MDDRLNTERKHRVWLAAQGVSLETPSQQDWIQSDLAIAKQNAAAWQARVAVCQAAADDIKLGVTARA